MKVAVAANERGDRRARPQTPCPLVQPLARRVPKPTRRPPARSVAALASIAGGGRAKEPAGDEGRDDQPKERFRPPRPVARARRNQTAEQPGGAEDATALEDEPGRRKPDEKASGQRPSPG